MAGVAVVLSSACGVPESPLLNDDGLSEELAPAQRRLARIELRVDHEFVISPDSSDLVDPAIVRRADSNEADPLDSGTELEPGSSANDTTAGADAQSQIDTVGSESGSDSFDDDGGDDTRHALLGTTTGGVAEDSISISPSRPGDDPLEEANAGAAAQPSTRLAGQPVHTLQRPAGTAQPGHAELGNSDDESHRIHAKAHFVDASGVGEAFLRAYSEIPSAVWDRAGWNRCIASDAGLNLSAAPGTGPRQITSIDAGDMHLVMDGQSYDLPRALGRDLFPYASGVSYELRDRVTGHADSGRGPALFHLSVEGDRGFDADDAVAGFEIHGRLPRPLDLRTRWATHTLELDWRTVDPSENLGPDSDGEELELRTRAVVVRLHALSAGEWIGDEVTCVFRDDTHAPQRQPWRSIDIDLQALAKVGLSQELDALWIRAGRQHVIEVDDASFGPVELLLEQSITTELDPVDDAQ